ncbi:MAG: alpha/beta hydrolase [Desulfovibrio sp.]|jgi:acetyl esterase/lipase|nr:alpha/beta hydrolase [Desulfovibrio sp.]
MDKGLNPALVRWLRDFYVNVEKALAAGFIATPTNAREFLAGLTRRHVAFIPDVASVLDDLAPGGAFRHHPSKPRKPRWPVPDALAPGDDFQVPLRIYHPDPGKDLPVLLYFHGGGHMCGSVTVYDPICRRLALAAKHIVVAADYRLAPENPWPAGVNDALSVARSVWSVLERRRLNFQKELSIAGDSAGGALCATLSDLARFEPGLTIKRQALIYPSLDYTLSLPSVEENAKGYLLEKEKIEWYFNNYLPAGTDREKVSPLFGEFTDELPETLVLTAEYCPLRDEGSAYHKKLVAAGVRSELVNFADMIHTYICMEDIVPDACRKTYALLDVFLNGKKGVLTHK